MAITLLDLHEYNARVVVRTVTSEQLPRMYSWMAARTHQIAQVAKLTHSHNACVF
jgi:hypothetical protein